MGTEGTEIMLAERFYPLLKSDIFLIYDSEDHSGIFVFKDGEIRERIDQEIPDFLHSLGLDLSQYLEKPGPYISPVRTLAVIYNSKPAAVTKLLGFETLPPGVVVKAIRNDAVLYYSEHGNISVQVYQLADKIEGPIYFIHNDTETNYFSCTMIHKGEDKGIFEFPEYTTDYIDELKSVNGFTVPEDIVNSFGIPTDLLFNK